MNLYNRNRNWTFILATIALLIGGGFVVYTNFVVNRFAKREESQIKMWSDAIQTQAAIISYTEKFFSTFERQEDLRVELLASAYRHFLDTKKDENVSIYLEIISNNISIPLVVTDLQGNILLGVNQPTDQQGKTSFDDAMHKAYSKYDPILIDNEYWLYYSQSLIYTELQSVMTDMFNIFLSDVVDNSVGLPVIITDSTHLNPIVWGGLDSTDMLNPDYIKEELEEMASQNMPIKVTYLDNSEAFIYYRNSDFLENIEYYSYLRILIAGFVIIIAYLFINGMRRSEQNQVWAGMAKETAHQLGTPITSLLGWIEMMKAEEKPFIGTKEMDDDINRLSMIAERFSKIGSLPTLNPDDIVSCVNDTMSYLAKRFKKTEFDVRLPQNKIQVPLNRALFSWVLENLTKNAIDAMNGSGKIIVEILEVDKHVIIEITDNGKGIPHSKFKHIFQPGYTTKSRGWGLGLSLTKRIVENYHKGKIFVKSSEIGKGTTFRIELNTI